MRVVAPHDRRALHKGVENRPNSTFQFPLSSRFVILVLHRTQHTITDKHEGPNLHHSWAPNS